MRIAHDEQFVLTSPPVLHVRLRKHSPRARVYTRILARAFTYAVSRHLFSPCSEPFGFRHEETVDISFDRRRSSIRITISMFVAARKKARAKSARREGKPYRASTWFDDRREKETRNLGRARRRFSGEEDLCNALGWRTKRNRCLSTFAKQPDTFAR